MAFVLENIITYLRNSKSVVLATVDDNNLPDLRTIGGYNFDALTFYFATNKTSNKVEQIRKNEKVSILVQHENQVLPNYSNITIYGRAKRLNGGDYEEGRRIILERRPLAIFEEDTKNIYKIIPEQIKILDLSKDAKEQVKIIKP